MLIRRALYLRCIAAVCTILATLLAPALPAQAESSPPILLQEFLAVDKFIQAGGVIYLTADDGTSGYELWKSDGTPEGTVMVKDINPGPEMSFPTNYVFMDGTLYFWANDGTHGYELWKSDGTPEGTVMIKDINHTGDPLFSAGEMVAIGNTLYFRTKDVEHGVELWKSDGTEAGTVLVKDIAPGPEDIVMSRGNSWPSYLTVVGDTLFFTADDNIHGTELWESDGTEAGTVLVKDLLVEPEDVDYPWSSRPADLIAFGDLLIFRAYTAQEHIFGTPWAMYRSDGTADGTVKLRDMFGGAEGVSDSWYSAVLNGELYVSAIATDLGDELWKTDGTEEGTELVKDVNPANGNFFVPSIPELLLVGETIFFVTSNGTHGYELWKSDGTPEGTVMVKDINLGGIGSSPRNFVAAGDLLYFIANDGDNEGLWQSDGEDATAVESVPPDDYKNIVPLIAGDSADGYPLYFFAITEDATGLWKLEGEEPAAPPVAVDDVAVTTGSTPVSGNVLSNDSDPQGSPLSVSSSIQPANGTVTVNTSGHFTYTATAGFSGVDVFTYTVSNDHGLTDTAQVIVVVQAAASGSEAPTVVTTTVGVTTTHVITSEGFNLSMQIPSNAYSGTLEPDDNFFLVYTPVVTPTGSVEEAPTNFQFAGMVFTLESYLNDTALESFTFGEPLILEIEYPASAVEGLDPATLTLLYWDPESEQWSSDGIEVRSHDIANRKITVAISHLTEFGLFSKAESGGPDGAKLFVPSVFGGTKKD